MPASDLNAYPRIGVAVIIVRDGKVLLGKRKGSHGAATWAVPGGHLEFGESIEDCARRELQEETGLLASTVTRGPYTNDVFATEGKHYVTLFVIAETDDKEPQVMEPDKCDAWVWFPWTALPSPLLAPVQTLLATGYQPSHKV